MATTDIQTGATAGGNAPVGYAQGVSNPPNGGQVTNVDNPEPNDAPTMVPIFAPDGSFGEVPLSRLHDAMNAGGKRAEFMVSPDGKTGYIPSDRVQDAVKAGAKFGSPDAQTSVPKNYGFTPGNILNSVGTGLKQLGQGVAQGLSDIGGAILPQALGGDPLNNLKLVHDIVDPMQADYAKAKTEAAKGHTTQSVGYAIASALPVIGPYAANLGEQAGAGDVGGTLARAGAQFLAPKAVGALPMATRALGRAALLGKTPEAAYESALKPPTTMSLADRAGIVKTGLENEIPIDPGGAEKIYDALEHLDNLVEKEITPGAKIDPNAAAQYADQTKTRFEPQVNNGQDLAAIEAVKQQFLRERGAKPGTPATPPQPTGLVDAQGRPIMNAGTPATPPQPAPPMEATDAQKVKRGTYQILRNKYGEQGNAEVEAQKDIARGLKDQIANRFPQLKDLNASMSKLLDLQGPLERAVARMRNQGFFKLGTAAVAGTVRAFGGSNKLAAVSAVLKQALDDPMVKSRLAISVSKASKIPIAAARAQVQAYATSLGTYAAAQGSASSEGNPSN